MDENSDSAVPPTIGGVLVGSIKLGSVSVDSPTIPITVSFTDSATAPAGAKVKLLAINCKFDDDESTAKTKTLGAGKTWGVTVRIPKQSEGQGMVIATFVASGRVPGVAAIDVSARGLPDPVDEHAVLATVLLDGIATWVRSVTPIVTSLLASGMFGCNGAELSARQSVPIGTLDDFPTPPDPDDPDDPVSVLSAQVAGLSADVSVLASNLVVVHSAVESLKAMGVAFGFATA